MGEQLDPADLSRLIILVDAKDRATAAANIALARAKLAEAEFEAVHVEIAKKYNLRAGDTYDDTGVIVRKP